MVDDVVGVGCGGYLNVVGIVVLMFEYVGEVDCRCVIVDVDGVESVCGICGDENYEVQCEGCEVFDQM